MIKKLFLLPIIFSFSLSEDAIVVSPSSLDFGNVLMGNTPTMTFTLTCNLGQTISITPPNFYSVDTSEIIMVIGQTQDVVVTFDPPQIGNYDSQIALTGATFGNAVVSLYANATNDLSGSMSGTLTSEFSPYEVSDDLIVESGNTWTIEAGTELRFGFGKRLTVDGTLQVNGNYENLVKLTSLDPDSGWAGVEFNNTDGSVLEYIDVSNVTNNLNIESPFFLFEDYEDGVDDLTGDQWGTIHTDEDAGGRKVATRNVEYNSNEPIFNIPYDVHNNNTVYVNIVFKVELDDSTSNSGDLVLVLRSTLNNSNYGEQSIFSIQNEDINQSSDKYRTLSYGYNSVDDKDIILYAKNNSNGSNVILSIEEVGVRFYQTHGKIGGSITFENQYSKFPGAFINSPNDDFETNHMLFVANDNNGSYFYTPNFDVIQNIDKTLSFDIKITDNSGDGNFSIRAYDDGGGSEIIYTSPNGQNLEKTTITAPITLSGSQYYFYLSYGLNYVERDFYIYIDNFKLSGSDSPGAITYNNSNNQTIQNSIISNSMGGVKLTNSNILLKNVVLFNNDYAGISINQSFGTIINSILWSNYIDILSRNNIGFSVDYSIFSSSEGEINFGSNNINQYPQFDLNTFELDLLSPAIDMGHPNDYDDCMPPGIGTLSADIGMYGGMNNCGSNESNIGGGLPTITTIEDLPQDQGGYVGIQFSGSYYDGSSDIYDVTHYSVWRELDAGSRNNIDISDVPIGQFYRTNNRDDEAWEYLGESPAQEFDVYGYTAPTLADSNYIGMFWSKYLVVAHTTEEDVFFVSAPDSGYSVDNLAPDDPDNVQIQTFVYENTLQWNLTTDEDFWQTEIKRNGEIVALGSNFNEFIETSINPGQLSHYEITHIDQNGNRSESSSRDVQSPEWIFRFETQSESVSNSNFYFAANDSASFGYDAMYDLFSAPTPPGEYIQLSVSHPEWETGFSDFYSYISVGNVDLEYFNREIVIDAHSTVNDTVTVQVYPDGNYNVGMFGVSINNNPISYIDSDASFDIPVSDSTITTIRVVFGNPYGSGGNISIVSPNTISVMSADPMDVVIAKSHTVSSIDIAYTTDGNNFINLDTSIVVNQVVDTIIVNWRTIMTDENIQHIPNAQYKVSAYDINGVLEGEDFSSQFTIIDDQFSLSLPTPDWRMVHPYYTDENMNDLLNTSLSGNFTAYWWNGGSQAYEIINNSDYVTQTARSVWVMNMNQR